MNKRPGEVASSFDPRPWLLAVAAVLVNVVFVLESDTHPAFQHPMVDAATYFSQALGESPAPPRAPYWQPPLYPWLLAVLCRIGLRTVLAARLAHAALGALTAVAVYAAGKRLMGPRRAVAAALITVFFGPLLFLNTQFVPAALAACLMAATLLLALRAAERPSPARGLACGAALGAAAINVPNNLVLLPVAAWFVARGGDGPLRARYGAAGCLAGAAAVCVLGVMVRNVVVSGQWVPISTNGGINLYIGNNPHMDRTIAARPGEDWQRLVALPVLRGGAGNEVEAQNWFFGQVAAYAARQPGVFLGGLLRKTRQFLNAREIPRNLDVYEMRKHSWLLGLLVWHVGPFGFPRGLFLPLALAGLAGALIRRSAPAWRFLAVTALAYAGSVVAFFPTTRYFIPLVPPLALLAVRGAVECAAAVRIWHTPAARRLLAVAAAALVAVNWPVRLPTDDVNFAAELEKNIGAAFQERGQRADALARYEAALRLDPWDADTWFCMGTLWRELNSPTQALNCQLVALNHRPDHRRAMNELAGLLFNRGKTDDAIRWLRRSLELDPNDRLVMANLAMGLAAQGRLQEAKDWRRKAGQPGVRALAATNAPARRAVADPRANGYSPAP